MTDEHDGHDEGRDRGAHGEPGATRGQAGAGRGGARSGGAGPSDGWTRGLEFLGSLKETIEEALGDAGGRGDLNVDRAASAVRDAVRRAQEATSDARERFDFVPREEFDRLAARVEALERRLEGDRAGREGTGEESTAPPEGTGGGEGGAGGAAQADGVP